jgi:cytochrome P450
MSVQGTSDVYYDPYDPAIDTDPYPEFRRLREEAPLYYNDTYDFYAVSRFEDVERALRDNETFSSARGAIIELIKANVEMPSGTVIFEDPPNHTLHRGLLSRVFTPKRVSSLEPQIRELCARSLDPLVGTGQFDFVRDLGSQMPMRVISMLLGIPEEDQEAVRDHTDASMRTEEGKPMEFAEGFASGERFAEYINWRATHPSDDIMTELLNAEFDDGSGVTRRLTRQEILTYVSIIAGAGNETTTRLIGWMGKVLADHPEQRRSIVEDRSLIPNAIEELLRFEPPAHNVARYVTRDVEILGQTVPEGSTLLLMLASANRDERRFDDPDRFDVGRKMSQTLTFGFGPHFCLGAALARQEGRIALDEVLNRFPAWEVDAGRATLASASAFRGWETLPVSTL